MNGDRSTADVAGIVFNETADTAAGQRSLRFNSFLTAKAPLAEAVAAGATVIALGSSHEVAPFRAGDLVHLINTNGTATAALTVQSTSPVSQTISLTAAPGAHPAGALVVRADPDAITSAVPGGACGESAGAPIDNQKLAAFLSSIQSFCGNDSSGWGSTQDGVRCDVSLVSNLVIDEVGPVAGTFVNTQSLVGATCTFRDDTNTAALRGQRAKVVGAAIAGNVVTLTLEQFESAPDADGVRTALTEWATTPAATDVFLLDLDLTSHNKLAELSQAGGDMTTMVSSILTMHRKLDPGSASPELPLRAENQVWQQSAGTLLKLALPYTNNTTTVVVEFDEAMGDLPIPRSGRIRLLNFQDGVNSTGGSAPAGRVGDGGFVSYTRAKRSATLTCAVTPDASGAGNFPAGCRAELDPAVNGLALNKGFAPSIDQKYISGVLNELMEAVRLYIPLEGRA
jgi:hypothetical protein